MWVPCSYHWYIYFPSWGPWRASKDIYIYDYWGYIGLCCLKLQPSCHHIVLWNWQNFHWLNSYPTWLLIVLRSLKKHHYWFNTFNNLRYLIKAKFVDYRSMILYWQRGQQSEMRKRGCDWCLRGSWVQLDVTILSQVVNLLADNNYIWLLKFLSPLTPLKTQTI